MTENTFENKFDNGDLYEQYAEYLMANRNIGNGNMLIKAMENQDMYEEFKLSLVDEYDY
jgi:hypothetical protein